MLTLSGCRQPGAWQFVPDNATAVVIADPEALLMDNLRLDQNPAMPELLSPGDVLAGPQAYPGCVYAFQMPGHHHIWFLLGKTDKPCAADSLILGMARVMGSRRASTLSHPVTETAFTLTAFFEEDNRHEAMHLLDSLSRCGPSQGLAFQQLPVRPSGLDLIIPDLARWLGQSQDSAFTGGRLWMQSGIRANRLQCRFAFTPRSSNPLRDHPILDSYSRLHPWPRGATDTSVTELSFRIRKGALMPRLRQDRRYRGLELMVGLFNIPAEELVASAGSDVYFRGEERIHGYSLTMSVSHPARMEMLLRGMIRDGSLSGPENRYLLGNRHTQLYSHGGLISLRHRAGSVPEAFGQRENVSLSLRANSAFLTGLNDLFSQGKGTGPKSPLRQIRDLRVEVLNLDDGSFTGTMELEHRYDLTRLAGKI